MNISRRLVLALPKFKLKVTFMRFNLTQVNILEENSKIVGLDITLVGDDKSSHNFKMDIKGLDMMSLSLRDIEKQAIKQVRHNFERCSNG